MQEKQGSPRIWLWSQDWLSVLRGRHAEFIYFYLFIKTIYMTTKLTLGDSEKLTKNGCNDWFKFRPFGSVHVLINIRFCWSPSSC